MTDWRLEGERKTQYENDGYFVYRGLMDRDSAMQIKGVIVNQVLMPEVSQTIGADADPMDPMNNNTAAGRAARFRKLGAVGTTSPVVWNYFYLNSALLSMARYFLGDDAVMKFNSCFLKPAKTGSSTPWHQDNGLWRDGDQESMNIWMAVDPATKENGCLQFIPGSHKSGVIHEHVMYEDSVHIELPREEVSKAKEQFGLEHIELQPGDAVIWHSNLYHYSPPNTSDKGRIAIAGVFSAAEEARQNPIHQNHRWVLRRGEPVTVFPAERLEPYAVEKRSPPPSPKA